MTTYGDDSMELCLYTNYVQEKDGTLRPIGYAYGAPWVQQALLMDDIRFDTPEEAKEWWYRNYGEAEG